jgi:hypothetical protein
MQTNAIIETVARDPASEQTWRRVALELGANLAGATREHVTDLIDGLSRLSREDAPPVVNGLRQAVLALLSGFAQAQARRRERALEDADLLRHTAKPFWLKVARAAAGRPDGIVRNRDLRALLKSDKGQISTALKGLIEAGLFERLEGDLEGDRRAELFRILPSGRRLVEVAPVEGRVAVPLRAFKSWRSHFPINQPIGASMVVMRAKEVRIVPGEARLLVKAVDLGRIQEDI